MLEHLVVIMLVIMWIYSSICIFLMFSGGKYYIESIPIMDTVGTYQIYNFIPLRLFTTYFDKKIYID
jgi:hypothetical protein